MNIKRSNLYSYTAFFFFLILCFLYFKSYNINTYSDTFGFFQRSLNIHDHLVYLRTIDDIRNLRFDITRINNDIGISLIYSFIFELFGVSSSNITSISFVFNTISLIVIFIIYTKICDMLLLGTKEKLFFFLGFQYIYFAQLINKDILTILILFSTVYFSLLGKTRVLILLIPLSMLIRVQLGAFMMIFIFIVHANKMWGTRITISYLVTSLIAGYWSVHYPVIGEESLGDGLSSYAIALNNKSYYTGYLLLNPLRVLQWIQELYFSFFIFTGNNGVDVAKLLRLPLLIILPFYFKKIFKGFRLGYRKSTSPQRPLVAMITAYSFTLLMNPTINARYVMLVIPAILLLGLHTKYHDKK